MTERGGVEWALSRSHWERSRQVLAGGVSTGLRAAFKPHPIFFDRAQGPFMWSVEGRRLIDLVLGWGAILLGHTPPSVVTAVQEQAARAEGFGAQHVLEYEVAEKVLTHFPFAERLLYSNTGTEATQVAIRLARAATGRVKVLKFIGHYHGWSDPLLISYRNPPEQTAPFLESRGQNPHMAQDIVVAPWNNRHVFEQILDAQGAELAAVIMEPILCNSGVIMPDPAFLQAVRARTQQQGIVLIFDEVITGYRVGLHGATDLLGVTPDLVVLGKAIANGYPLSVVLGDSALIDQAAGGGVVHAGTFNGNPIVLAAARATLEALEQPGAYESLEAQSTRLAAGLRAVLGECRVSGVIHQVAGVLQLIPGIDGPITDYTGYISADWPLYDRLSVELLNRGVFVMPGGRIYLSMAHDSALIDEVLTVFHAALTASVSAVSP